MYPAPREEGAAATAQTGPLTGPRPAEGKGRGPRPAASPGEGEAAGR